MLMNGFDGQITTARKRRVAQRGEEIADAARASRAPSKASSSTAGSQRRRTK